MSSVIVPEPLQADPRVKKPVACTPVAGEEVQHVRIAGAAAAALVEPTNAAPAADAYGVPVRPIGASGLTDAELRAAPVPVTTGAKAPIVDIFRAAIVAQRNNQVEVDFSAGDPNTLVTITKTSTGAATSHEGHAHFTTGANASGTVRGETVERVKYRPLHEIYVAFTAAFSAPVAASYQRIGLYDDTNGFIVGSSGSTMGVYHRRNGVDTFIPVASFNEDTLDGSAGSAFTLDGDPVAIDWTKTNVFLVPFGFLGSAPIEFYAMSPDGDWVLFHKIRQPNSDPEPSITSPNLPIRVEAGGAANLAIRSACWAAGTTSQLSPIGESVTAKTLAVATKSVIWARKPNGDYTDVAANTKGRLLVANDSVTATGAAVPTDATMVGGTDGTNLRALLTDTLGRLRTLDRFTGGEVLADQSGAGAALTFTFSAAVDLVWVRVDGGAGRADPFGGTPTNTAGIYCEDATPNPITVAASTVKVWAPTATTVRVWGFRY